MKLHKSILIIYVLSCFSTFIYAQLPAIYDLDNYINKLSNKNIGLVVNQSSLINNIHLVDTLMALVLRLIIF